MSIVLFPRCKCTSITGLNYLCTSQHLEKKLLESETQRKRNVNRALQKCVLPLVTLPITFFKAALFVCKR